MTGHPPVTPPLGAVHAGNWPEVRTVDPLLEPSWDEFVWRNPDASVFHLTAWERVLRRYLPNLGAFCQILPGENDLGIDACLPLFEVDAGWRGRSLVAVPMAPTSDPLASDETQLSVLLDAAVEVARRRHVVGMRLHTRACGSRIRTPEFTVRRRYLQHSLRLAPGPERLLKACDGGCVRNRIRKALRSNLQIRRAQTDQDLGEFYRLHVETRRRLGLPVPGFTFFSALWEILGRLGAVEILLAIEQRSPVAALLLLKWRNRVSAEVLAYSSRSLDLCANHFLFWKAIERAFAEGYEIFDFGRTPVWEKGLVAFKERWGTEVCSLPVFVYQPSHPPNGLTEESPRRYYSIARRLLRWAPLPLYRLLSETYYQRCA